MSYEIGQKVVTPLGFVGEIVQSGDEMSKVAVRSVDGNYIYSYKFMNEKLKLYRTPHEKLLDMGFEFEEVLDWGGNPFSHNWRKDDQRITIYLSENTITTYEVCKEAIAVLTQYLEWLEVRND